MKKLIILFFILASLASFGQNTNNFTGIVIKNSHASDSSGINKIWYNAATAKFRFWDGTGKHTFGVGTGGGLSTTLSAGHLYVGNVSNVATDVALSGDGGLSSAGALTITKLNGKTVTLGGNLTYSGAFNTTHTVTGSNTITWPNASITVARIDAAQTFTGVQTFSSLPTIPATPSAATDAASKGYVDGLTVGPFSTVAAGYTNLSGNANSLLKGNNTWIAPGANGQVMNVVAGVPTWSDLILGPFSTTLNGYVLTSGGAGRLLLGDNTWLAASGTSGKILVSNGTTWVNSTPTFPNTSATTRKIIVSDGTNWLASTETYAVPGTSGNVLTSNGTNWTSAAPISAGWNLTGATNLTGAVTINGTATNTLTWDFGNLGSTDTDGAGGLYTNTTAATSGTFLVSQNHSPNIAFKAFAYKSNATAASKSSVMRISNDPLQATSGIVGNLAVKSNIDGAGDKYIFAIQRNELNGTTVNIYDTYTNATTYDRLLLSGDYFGVNAGFAIIKDRPGSSGPLYIGNEQDGTIQFRVNAGQRWSIYNAGSAYSFVPNADNVYDLGGNPVAGNIARNIYGYKIRLGGSAAPAATAEITQAALSSAWQPALIVQPGAHTAMTAATEFPNIVVNAVSQKWVDGTVATQRWNWIKAPTVLGTTTLATVTDGYNLYVDAPLAGSLGAVTKPWAIGSNGNLNVLGTISRFGGATGVFFNGNTIGFGGTDLAGAGNIAVYDGTITTTNISGFSFASVAGDPRVNNANGVNYSIGGSIKDYLTDVNNGTTVETDLYTFTTLASTLSTDGDKLYVKYSGTFNDVTATSQLKVYFGGTAIGDTGALTVSAIGGWEANACIIRTGSTTVRATVSINTPGASTALYTKEIDVTGLTLSSTNIIKITGQAGGGTGGSNDITSKFGSIVFIPAAP